MMVRLKVGNRAFDPLRRAKDFPRMPSPRKETSNLTREVRRIGNLADLALSMASTPSGETRIEYVTALPDATALDIGRKIVVSDPLTNIVSEYTCVLSADGVPYWMEVVGAVNILAYSWVSNFAVTGPQGLDIRPSDNAVLVSRTAADRVETYSPGGALLQSWGAVTSCAPVASGAQIYTPYGIAYVGMSTCFIANRDCHNVTIWSDVTNTLASANFTIGSTLGSGPNALTQAGGLAVDANALYIADSGNNRIIKRSINPPYGYLGEIGAVGSGDGQLNYPFDVAIDGSGNIYVADTNNNRIQKFTSAGTFVWKVGELGSGPGDFNSPRGLTFDPLGRLHVTDHSNHRVQVFDRNGVFLTQYGSAGSGNGQFNQPTGIAITPTGLVYVADFGNNRVSVWQEGAAIPAPPVPSVLNDLQDVTVSGSLSGQFLRWAGSFWRNESISVNRRTSNINNINPGFCGTTSATCQAGEVVVGGGFANTTSNARGPYRSRPGDPPDRWECGYCNQDDVNITVVCYAMCLRLLN